MPAILLGLFCYWMWGPMAGLFGVIFGLFAMLSEAKNNQSQNDGNHWYQ